MVSSESYHISKVEPFLKIGYEWNFFEKSRFIPELLYIVELELCFFHGSYTF